MIRDLRIDYIKGVCMLLIVLCNLLFVVLKFPSGEYFAYYWLKAAVPLLFAVHAYLVFSHPLKSFKVNVRNLFSRCVCPYFLVQIVLFLFFFSIGSLSLSDFSAKYLSAYGIGVGCYFFFVFLQYFVVVRLIKFLEDRFSFGLVFWGVTLAFFSWCFELLSIHFGLSEYFYVVSVFSYLFLIFLGMFVARFGWKFRGSLFLGVLGFFFVWVFAYSDVSSFPFFYSLPLALDRHFPSYFYHVFVFCPAVLFFYSRLPSFVSSFFCFLGRNSWYIYLLQMSLFVFFL